MLLCAVAAKPEAPSAPGRRGTPARLSLRLSLCQAGALRANTTLGAGALVWASVESEQVTLALTLTLTLTLALALALAHQVRADARRLDEVQPVLDEVHHHRAAQG